MKNFKAFMKMTALLGLVLALAVACNKEESLDQQMGFNEEPTDLPILAMGDATDHGGDTDELLTDCNCIFTINSITGDAPPVSYRIFLPDNKELNLSTGNSETFSADSGRDFMITYNGLAGGNITLNFTINCGGDDYTNTIEFTDGTQGVSEVVDVAYELDEDCNLDEACGCTMTVKNVSWLILPTVNNNGPFPTLEVPEFNRQWSVDNPNPSFIDMVGIPGPLPASDYFVVDGNFDVKVRAFFPDQYLPDHYEAYASIVIDCGENSLEKLVYIQQDPQEVSRGSTTFTVEFEEGCEIKTFPF